MTPKEKLIDWLEKEIAAVEAELKSWQAELTKAKSGTGTLSWGSTPTITNLDTSPPGSSSPPPPVVPPQP